MKLKDLRIGIKLYGGFTAVLLLTLLVGLFAYRGISRIVYQLEISKKVNRIIVDGGDAQAASLRYIIYGDDSYLNISKEESDNIKNASMEAKEKMLSSENKKSADNIHSSITAYEKTINDYYLQEQKKLDALEKRGIAAQKATNEIIQVINALKNYSLTAKDDYATVQRIFKVQEARNEVNRARIAANKYQINPNEENEKIFLEEIKSTSNSLTEARDMMNTEKDLQKVTAAITAIDEYKEQFRVYKAVVQKQNEIQSIQREAAGTLLSEARNLREGVYSFIENTKVSSYTMFIVVLSSAIILGLIIGTIITRGITIPLAKGVKFANAISAGSLTDKLEIEQKDEVGQLGMALQNMLDKLREIVASVMDGADQVAAASQQISSTAQEISQGANEQASSVEEVSSTMEEITANIEQNSENATETEKISMVAQDGIKDVNSRSQETVGANKNIAEKIGIINDIAFQTNILALNAAVEAARAGEHGKGFAVVAAEVRKLAERSKVAAEEIVSLAQNSLILADNAGQKMQEILPEVEKTARLVQEISAASNEQKNGSLQINNAIQQLNTVTQQSAASSEELATSSELMNSQAEQLRDIISFFKIDENGKSVFRGKKTTDTKLHATYQKKGNGNKNTKLEVTATSDEANSEFENF